MSLFGKIGKFISKKVIDSPVIRGATAVTQTIAAGAGGVIPPLASSFLPTAGMAGLPAILGRTLPTVGRALPGVGAVAGGARLAGVARGATALARGAATWCRKNPAWCASIGGTAAVEALIRNGQLPMPKRRRAKGISASELKAFRRVASVIRRHAPTARKVPCKPRGKTCR